MEMAKEISGNNEKLTNLAMQLVDDCDNSILGVIDRCKMGMIFLKCLHNGLITRKIDLNFDPWK